MIKKLILKLLKLETPAEKLVRLETNQLKLKEGIERGALQRDRLTDILGKNEVPLSHIEDVEVAIELVDARLAKMRKNYSENQLVIIMARTTLEAQNGLLA